MGLSSDYKCLLDLPSSRAALLASVSEVASLNAWEAFQVFAMLVAAMQRWEIGCLRFLVEALERSSYVVSSPSKALPWTAFQLESAACRTTISFTLGILYLSKRSSTLKCSALVWPNRVLARSFKATWAGPLDAESTFPFAGALKRAGRVTNALHCRRPIINDFPISLRSFPRGNWQARFLTRPSLLCRSFSTFSSVWDMENADCVQPNVLVHCKISSVSLSAVLGIWRMLTVTNQMWWCIVRSAQSYSQRCLGYWECWLWPTKCVGAL